MMDLQTIISLNKKAGKQAREDDLEPKVLNSDDIHNLNLGDISSISDIPYLGTHIPSGCKKFDVNKLKDKLDLPSWWYSSKILPRGELWCDSSGFGESDEPALNTLQLIKVISRLFKNKPGLGFGLYSTGQFQVGVRVFDVA